MADPTITYAVVGGPPHDWHGLQVFDAAGKNVSHVIEVNTEEGWLVRFKLNEQGNPYPCPSCGKHAVRERVEGCFTIRRPTVGMTECPKLEGRSR